MTNKYETPFYVFDQEALDNSIERFLKAFKKEICSFRSYYAVKINHHSLIIKRVIEKGMGLDVGSPREIDIAVKAGCKDIVYYSPGKTKKDILHAIKHSDVVTIHIDSLEELKKLGSKRDICEVSRILVDLLRSIEFLINEGVIPGNKQHGFILRKMIRSFLEILWLSVGSIISSEELIRTFVEFNNLGNVTLVVEIIRKEDQSFQKTLNRGKKLFTKNPGLKSNVLRETYGIRQSLLPLLK